jgi:hypothetical protein
MGPSIRQLLVLVMAPAGPAIGAVATKPQEATEYEFIPGPGMPSLESLGLTVEQLFNSTWVGELFRDTPPAGQTGTLSRRLENNCEHDNAPVEAIRACGAFLHILGNYQCVGENTPVVLAEVKQGDYFARVEGLSIQAGRTQSSCLHAGMAVYWVADNCIAGCDPVDFCVAGGAAHAWGNDNFFLIVWGNYY